MANSQGKSEHAFRTISELATELGVPQHILRYWETRFPQLKPLQRAGNRRYYRPADVALAHHIHRLLNQEGYTVRGVQKLLAKKNAGSNVDSGEITTPAQTMSTEQGDGLPTEKLQMIRDLLVAALAY